MVDPSFQNNGKPYCHIPCYGVLFGPKGVGHGGVESYVYEKKEDK